MNRREAISRIGLLLGGTVIGSSVFVQLGCSSNSEQVNDLFDQDQVNLLNEIAETILPTTDTPGAKAVDVGSFMAVVVKNCYSREDQKIFLNGLAELDETCIAKHGSSFLNCNAIERKRIIESLDAEQELYMEENLAQKKRNEIFSNSAAEQEVYLANGNGEEPNHYFRMMKELTLLGYFTSEIGATRALRYVKIPGAYDGCTPYTEGDTAWFAST